MHYADYEHMQFSVEDGILAVTLNRPARLNAVNERLHFELSSVWGTAEADARVSVILVRGAEGNFCSGGDLEMVDRMSRDAALTVSLLDETAAIVHGMIDCPKPIVTAVEGTTIGAGLLVALLADISVVAEDARLSDGHARIGVVAGDHAALVWPLLCGMAKAKRWILTGDFVTGAEADRIGLVSESVPAADVLSRAHELAQRLRRRDPLATAWTKRAFNHWLRDAGPIFEHSLALEMLSFSQPGARAAIDRIRGGASTDG